MRRLDWEVINCHGKWQGTASTFICGWGLIYVHVIFIWHILVIVLAIEIFRIPTSARQTLRINSALYTNMSGRQGGKAKRKLVSTFC